MASVPATSAVEGGGGGRALVPAAAAPGQVAHTAARNDDDDIVKINIGGTRFEARRNTLCSCGGFFETYFSDRWKQDKQQAELFLDLSPELFAVLLSYLRAKTMGEAIDFRKAAFQQPPAPLLHLKHEWQGMLRFLGYNVELVVGVRIDAIDDDNVWYESEIVAIEIGKIKVHYLGWEPLWDAWIPIESDRWTRLHTHTKAWRDEVKVNDMIEVKYKEDKKWYRAQVIKKDQNTVTVSACYCPDTFEVEVDVMGDDVGYEGMHIKWSLDGRPLKRARPE